MLILKVCLDYKSVQIEKKIIKREMRESRERNRRMGGQLAMSSARDSQQKLITFYDMYVCACRQL